MTALVILLRAIKFWTLTTIATVAIFIAISLTYVFRRHSSLFSYYSRIWGRTITWAAGVKLERHGAAPPEGTFLVVANHASGMDIPLGFSAIPYDFRFVSRPLFFKVPFLGWAMTLSGHISLDPKNPRDAARSLRELGPHLEAGRSILIFPEGTRSPDGSIAPYKRGPVPHGDPEPGADPPPALRRDARDHAQRHLGPEARRRALGRRRADRDQGAQAGPMPNGWRARSMRGLARPALRTRAQTKSGRPREPSPRRVPCRRELRAATDRLGRARRSR